VGEEGWDPADAVVYFGGTLFRLPRGAIQPWPGTDGTVNVLPGETSSMYMGPAADGTLLTDDKGT
jgi:hypothetical protein